MERSFESVVFPNVPISQYSIAASSFSGSAKYLSAIIMALDMAFITMPASTYVLVDRERVALTSSITHTTAASPPQKAPLAIANMPDVETDTIAMAAPRFAPPAMPIISGDARGFLNIIWYTLPATPSPTPAIIAIMVRERRSVKNTLRVISSTSLPENMARMSSTVMEYLPTQIETTAATNIAAVTAANNAGTRPFFADFPFTF